MADVFGAIRKKVLGDLNKQVGSAAEAVLDQAPVVDSLVDYEPVELEIGPIDVPQIVIPGFTIPAFKVPMKFNKGK